MGYERGRKMSATVVTISSGKGGVGKTTTTANLAVALASSGKKVVCIDGDIGLRNLDVVMGLENRIVYDIVDIIEGRCRIRQAMIRDKRGVTIIWVEHIMGVLMRVVDRCVVLDHGEVIAEGKPQAVVHDPRVVEVYLGTDADEVQKSIAMRQEGGAA